MDNQTQSFLELSAKNDLVQLVADKRAAWLWSADGARILWANAAGASFFSAQSISDLAGLASLERSPARPHISRIAKSGLADRFSIDRLRFYRGLRVMLLTCQCKRVELENGETAALIVCSDKGLALTKEPISSFARLLRSSETTVFLMSKGGVDESFGSLDGVPEDLDLPESQRALFGPLDLNGSYHEGVILQIPAGPKIVVLDDDPLSDDAAEGAEEAAGNASSSLAAADAPDTLEAEAQAEEVETADQPAESTTDPEEHSSDPDLDASDEPLEATAETPTEEDTVAIEDLPVVQFGPEASDPTDADPDDTGSTVTITAASLDEDTPEQDEAESSASADEVPDEAEQPEAFVFQPRRRSVRFAWKMDVDQRFTFLSDEFSEVLGPEATDIVGLTWEEVSKTFGLDPRGNIARALDRRDTWSGKSVDWPVSGAPLRVPVDMAALPAFDRNRKFEGYRGFGVCRTTEAIKDPNNPVLAPLTAPLQSPAEEVSEDDPDQLSDAAESDEANSREVSSEEDIAASVEDVVSQADSAETDLEAETATGDDETEVETEAGAEDGTAPEVEPYDYLEERDPPGSDEALHLKKKLEDLKPAQPDSFAGKTFLGASAAALVGSLAKFTGKSGSQPVQQPDRSTQKPEHQPAENENLFDDLQSAAAALDEKLDNADTDVSVSDPQDPPEAEDTVLNGTEDEVAEELLQEDDVIDVEAPEEQPLETTAAQEDVADSNPADAEHEEPTGISGPAELKPAEIEDAVKSLQKSYNASEKLNSLDLFNNAEVERDDRNTAASAEEIPEADAAAEDRETEAAESDDLEAPSPTASDADETFDDEGVDAASADDQAGVNDEVTADERDFFEETAAFGQEDQGQETDADTTQDPEPVKTGEIIPLATARPRVVPVDTSGLSRPERQAFRKIAEALGARLEGDLEDFESPDPEEEIEELPPEVPEAGPIDPTLLDRLPIGIAIVHDREVLYANKALLRMLGYKSIAALSQAGGLEALFIDDTEELPDAVGMDGEVDETMKMRLADGGILCVDAHMHSVPWNDSSGLMISITERPVKQTPLSPPVQVSSDFSPNAASELENARNQIAEMDTILETATDGVLVLDQHGTIVKVNGSAEALFSANRVDMVGAPFTDFLAPESHRAAADYLDGLSRNGVASILNDGREVLGKVPTGGLIPLFMTIGRITSTGEDAKYCAVLRDITQWKTAEEELTQAKRQAENASSQKSDFLAKISHEIRTPLNAIIGFSEVMMEERFGPIGNDRYKDYLKDIRTSGSHIMSLINDLLDLSKIEAGKLDLNFSAVTTSDVINECVALMQPQANRERVIIRASLPESVPDVVADPRSLRQIVLNLLSNAIKYNKSGGQVILSTALESNGEVALRVRDTGTGMTAKQLAAALEPFRQLHTTSRGGGTGLGLPLTKALVEANRASFHIDSTPDQGTLVEIVFPTQRVLSE